MLIVDYGPAVPRLHSSLRGFSRHRLVHDILERPGEIDITADVDFASLKYVPGRAFWGVAPLAFARGGRLHTHERLRT